MISCEENHETTRELRGYKEGDIVPKDFYNRTCSRIVMETYGLPLSESVFTDAKQLLCVFRDAIAGTFSHLSFMLLAECSLCKKIGHQEMLKAGSLHRNISQENIVHGKPGAKPGNRGILVDFYRATSYDPENMSGTQTDWTIVSSLVALPPFQTPSRNQLLLTYMQFVFAGPPQIPIRDGSPQ
jgi:hypothetical protein